MTEVSRVYSLRDPLGTVLSADLTRPQLHAVLALSHEPLPMGELSRRLGATGPTTTGIVDRLEKLCMVERRRDTRDRRVVNLHLTDKGQAQSQRFLAALEKRVGVLLGLLEESDRIALVEIIERLAARAVDVAESGVATGDRNE